MIVSRKTFYERTNRVAARDQEAVMFANTEGEVIAEYAWPPKSTGYVGISRSLTRIPQGPVFRTAVTDALSQVSSKS